MNSKFGKVAVLMGGNSAEREVSLNSGQAVYAGLCKASVDAHEFDTGLHGIEELAAGRFDRAWIALHGRGGEDGSIQGALDYLGLPYTGSDVLSCALAMDKVKSKKLWQQSGLPTASYQVAVQTSQVDYQHGSFDYPVFVKPALEGSSIGITKVMNQSGLAEALTKAWESGCDALIEEYLPGDEVTVAILNDKALPVIRLEVANEFYDYAAKYVLDSTNYHCPSGLTKSLESEVQGIAERAFETLGCSGWGRVDLKFDEHGKPNLLEANLVPGMTDHSLVPMAASAAGIDFNDLVVRILETSL
ncbi:MAG: D-alanine--D-alanine ligase [Proteobacteria bacterium]|jgi:D-alanine-D-alanine ligase|nr:D-alanine--D-alanine ligase [Pseudomonadota bacterium]